MEQYAAEVQDACLRDLGGRSIAITNCRRCETKYREVDSDAGLTSSCGMAGLFFVQETGLFPTANTPLKRSCSLQILLNISPAGIKKEVAQTCNLLFFSVAGERLELSTS